MRIDFDTGTLVFSAMLTDVVCLLVILLLWHQSRKRFAGTGFWVLDFAFQTAGLLLITLRGNIPGWMSMALASTLILGGTILGYVGLGRFVGKKTPQVHNIILLGAFACIQVYFALVRPNLAARNLNISTALLIVYFQCMWLLLSSVGPEMRRLTLGVGMVFGGYCLFTIARVGGVFFAAQGANDFLQSGGLSLVFISYQVLFILLTYSLVLMVNKRLFAEVQIQEEKFAKAFRSSPYAIALTRLSDGGITEVNDGFLNITGYRYAEAVGKKSVDLHLWDKEEDRATLITELSKNGKVQNREFQFRKKSGEKLTGLLSAEVITINNQESILSSINDITERKRSEEALRENQALLSAIMESTPDPVYVKDDQSRIVTANPALAKVVGKPLEQILGRTDSEYYGDLDAGQALREHDLRVMESGQTEVTEETVPTPDGYRTFLSTKTPYRSASGDIIGVTGISRDITERKRIEMQSKEVAEKYSALFNANFDGVWIHDLNGDILEVNDAYCRMSGYSRDELIHMPISRVVAVKTPEEIADHIKRVVETDGHDRFESRHRRKDGSVFDADVTALFLERGSGSIATFVRDITERKKIEQALRQSEERYRHLVKYAPTGIYEIDFITGRFTEVNDAMCQILGYTRDELLAMTAFNILDDEGRARFASRIRLGQSGGRPNETAEYLVRAKDGRLIWGLLNVTFRWKDDKIVGATVIAYDITERKRAEEALRESEERLRLAQEAGHVGVWDFNLATAELRWSPELEAIYGLEPGSVRTYQDFATHVHPDDLKTMETKRDDAVNRQKTFEYEFRIQRPCGEIAWVYCRGGATYDPAGRPTRVFGVNIDITDRKRAEEALSQSRTKYQSLIETTSDFIWEMDGSGKYTYCSPQMETLWGLKPEAMIGKSPFDLMPGEDIKSVKEYFMKLVSSPSPFSGLATTASDSQGRLVFVETSGVPFFDDNGKLLGFRGITRDITKRTKAEEALKKAYNEMEKRVQERTSELSEAVERLRVENIQRKRLEDTLRESENQVRFFASQCLMAQETERKRVAGELHDSIAASLAATKFGIEKIAEEMKQGNGTPESLQELASRVSAINNDVRRIMADLRPSVLDDLGIVAAINWFCREYQKTYSHISVENQIGISEPEVPDSLKTPIFRISQEAMNNIAKHSQANLVNLSLQKEDDKIMLTIQDNGKGFNPEATKRGMGLSTMRERAQLSGGSFHLESAVGKGTIIRASWTI